MSNKNIGETPKKKSFDLTGSKKYVAVEGKMLPIRVQGERILISTKAVEVDYKKVDSATKRILRMALVAGDIKEAQ